MYAKSNSMFGGKGHPGFRNVLFSPKYNGNSEKSTWNSHDVLIIRKVNPEFGKGFIFRKIHSESLKRSVQGSEKSIRDSKKFIDGSEKFYSEFRKVYLVLKTEV